MDSLQLYKDLENSQDYYYFSKVNENYWKPPLSSAVTSKKTL